MMVRAQTSEHQTVTVPVLIDARRTIDDVKVVRAVYLIMTSETPVPGGVVQPGAEAALPVPILGQMGVIYQPDTSSETFTTADKIEALFATLEEALNYVVELEDIWIPESWLQHRPDISRRDLYRLTFDLFAACYRYRQGIITEIGSLTDLNPDTQEIRFSPVETQAFRNWNQRQIQDAIEIYPKNADFELEWDEDKRYN